MSAAAERREPIDLEEFERRLRAPEVLDSSNDPLADLARLVAGQGRPARDPFASIFNENAPKPPPIPMPAPPQSRVSDVVDELPDLSAMMRRSFDENGPAVAPAQAPSFRMPTPPPVAAPQPDEFHGSSEYEDWAEQDSIPPDAAEPAVTAKRSKKPLYLTAGVILAGFVMIGASLSWRSGGSSPAGVNIIKAASGPTKVQPEGQATSDASGQPATVLDKSSSTPPVKKVVSRSEAPMDVAASEKLPRVIPLGESAASSAPIPPPPARTSESVGSAAPPAIFPEPKKVKTVAVRADGTIISSNSAPAAAPPAPRVMPGSVPPARNATPKSDARAAATPAPTLADTSTAAPSPSAARAKPPVAPPKPPVAAKPAPKKEVAAVAPQDDASDDDAAPEKPAASAGGGFAIQLAAPGSESEARQVASRLGEKYSSQLGGRRPSVVKASDKAVYRVRVGGLSREAATAGCERIKAAGGACFVAR